MDLTKPPPSEDEQKEEDKTVESNIEEDDGKEKKVSISTYFQFFLVMVNSTLISMIKYLNQFSRDYRYIRKILAMEKKILKVYIYIYPNISLSLEIMLSLVLNEVTSSFFFLRVNRKNRISERVTD